MPSPMREAAERNLKPRATFQPTDNRIIGAAEENELLKTHWGRTVSTHPVETTIQLKGSGTIPRGKGKVLAPIGDVSDTMEAPTASGVSGIKYKETKLKK